MIQILLDNWGIILTVIFAIIACTKLVLTSQQKTAITLIWDAVKEIMIVWNQHKNESEIKKEVMNKIKATGKLSKVAQKIDNTDGFTTKEIVSIMVDNHSLIKDVLDGAWKFLKGFKKIF